MWSDIGGVQVTVATPSKAGDASIISIEVREMFQSRSIQTGGQSLAVCR